MKSSRGNEIRRKKIGKIFESRESFPLFTLPLPLPNDRARIEKRNSGTAEKFKSMEEKKGGC